MGLPPRNRPFMNALRTATLRHDDDCQVRSSGWQGMTSTVWADVVKRQRTSWCPVGRLDGRPSERR